MSALRLHRVSPLLTSVDRDLPIPSPAAGEVLVRIHAAGVTPTEVQWYPSTHAQSGEPRLLPILGHEFSGIIAAIGAGVSEFQIGDEVYGMNDWFADGATAEYCLTTPAFLAPKPQRLSHAEAATVPISALTAWQALHERTRLAAGERILIHGASGAVGIFVVQLARRLGAHVIATGSARHAEFLRSLGAAEVLDYRTTRFEDHVTNIDVVFDGVGGETLQRSWNVLAPQGRLVTIAADSEGTADARTKSAFLLVEARAAQLREIAALLDQGELVPCLDAALPLAESPAAYAGTAARPLGRGKLAITLPA